MDTPAPRRLKVPASERWEELGLDSRFLTVLTFPGFVIVPRCGEGWWFLQL